jgi:deoxyribose-phosphate aldolase
MYTKQQIAAALDYAVLKPTACVKDVTDACVLGEQEKFASVCVRPCDIRYACGFNVPISTVIGFPHGTTLPYIKLIEAKQAIGEGAVELDIVMNYSRLRDKDYRYVKDELLNIAEEIPERYTLKVILETCYLTPSQITKACKLIGEIPRIAFVKTSTGFGPHSACCSVIEIMLEAIKGSHLQIKASGGIYNYHDVETFLDLGCTRLGSSQWESLLT